MSENKNNLNVEWVKCHHGVEKRNHCQQCEEEKSNFLNGLFKSKHNEAPTRIPIYRGCPAKEGCFCSGRCKDIIGYRDPVYPGEKR